MNREVGRQGREKGGRSGPAALRSPRIYDFMSLYFERFFRRHMNGLRLARWGVPEVPSAAAGPLVVYSNHPAWWDGAVYMLLARRLFPAFEHYCPMDAAMLAKYRVFARIGGYGIDLESVRGAAAFLKVSADLLAKPDRALWVAAQGRFSDARLRPLGLRPGVARLAELAPGATFLPLAVEYAFWTERGAEALVAFGPPLRASDLAALPRPERLARLEAELTGVMDRLAADALTRDPGRFDSLLEGRPGIGGVYDSWRRAKALLRGQRFDPAHKGEPAG